MRKQVLYIMCGLPYSGKTTLTKELVNRFGFNRVSMDDVINEKKYDPETMTQKHWDEVYSKGYERLKESLKEGQSTILDLGNLKKSERDTVRAIAQSLNIEFKLIYLKIPVDEVKKRWLENEKVKIRGQLSEKELKRAINMFREPTFEENSIIYNQKMDLEEWIKKHIN